MDHDVRIIVYTALVGGYDYLRPIPEEEGVEYCAFLDRPQLLPSPWTFHAMPERKGLGFRQWSRLPKLSPHRYLPEHEVSIWVDANLRFRGPFVNWAMAQVASADIAVHRHPYRSCTYDEATRCIDLSLDHADAVRSHVAALEAEGFPRGIGLGENCFMVRRDTPQVRRLDDAWLDRYQRGSQRDQLSFMPAVWQTKTAIWFIDQNSRDNAIYTQRRHLKHRRVNV